MDALEALENLASKTLLLSRRIQYKHLPVLQVNFDEFQITPTTVLWYIAATMKISEYVVVIRRVRRGGGLVNPPPPPLVFFMCEFWMKPPPPPPLVFFS